MTIYFSKPIPIEDINKSDLINIRIINYKTCVISFNINNNNTLYFQGNTNYDKLLSINISIYNNSIILILLEFFIVNFKVLFLTDDEQEIFFREPNTPIEYLYERTLKEFGLQKYLRYKKIIKIKNNARYFF